MAKEVKEGNPTVDDLNLFSSMSDMLEGKNEIIEDDSDTEIIENNQNIKDVLEDNEDPNLNNTEEEDEDSKVEDEPVDEEIDTDEDDEQPSLFTPYAKFLVEEGVLSTLDLDKFDGTVDSLKKAMVDELAYYNERQKAQMPPEIKRLLDGYEKGVPFDEMLKISSDRIRYDNITDEVLSSNTDLQKNLVRDYLDKTTKFSDTMKDKMIAQWEDSLELEEQAKNALSELSAYQDQLEQQAIQRQELEAQEFEKMRIETITKLDKHIKDTEEIIPGIKINQMVKDKIKNNLTVPVAYDEYGNPINKVGKYMMENPIEGEVVLNYIFEITNGFKDWSSLGKAGKSQALRELENAQKAMDGKNKGNVNTRKNSTGRSELKDAISGFLK